MPGGPAALGELVFVPYRVLPLQINQHEVGIVAFDELALAFDVLDAGWSSTHPLHDLLQCAAARVDGIKHQGE